MAMTKTERAEMDRLEIVSRANRALRWSTFGFADRIEPDVPVPQSGHTEGWTFNSYGSGRVERAWSEMTVHGSGEHRPHGDSRRSGTRGGKALFSSRLLALSALRSAKEREFATVLAQIDIEIQTELRNPPDPMEREP